MKLRLFRCCVALFLSLPWASVSAVETVTITFEDLPLPFDENQSIRGPFPDDQSERLGGTTGQLTLDRLTLENFNLPNRPGSPFEDFFTGFSFSQRSLATVAENQRFFGSNDLIAVDGIGDGNSMTWAVVFDSGILTTDSVSTIDSLSFNNTLITRDIVSDDTVDVDGFYDFGAFRGLGSDQEFGIRFVDQSASGSGGTISRTLAAYDLASDTVTAVEDWNTVDLRSLDSNRIAIEFFSTDTGSFGINTPTYVAIDNVVVTSVPEPSMMVGVVMLGLFVARRRR